MRVFFTIYLLEEDNMELTTLKKQYGQQSRCEMRQDLSEVGTVMLG